MAGEYSDQRLVVDKEFEGVLEKPEILDEPVHQSPQAPIQLRPTLDPGWQIFMDPDGEEVTFAFPLPVDRKQFILAHHLKRFSIQQGYDEPDVAARPSLIEGESMFSWLSLTTTWPINAAFVNTLNTASNMIVEAFKTGFKEYHLDSSNP